MCVKNGWAAVEQITLRDTAVFLFAKASHNKLMLFPNNYSS